MEGLSHEHWQNASPVCRIFREAFMRASLTYFQPHSFRHTLVHIASDFCTTPEQFKAWSQNLGHENVLTTFTSYGTIDPHRQCEMIRGLGKKETQENMLEMLKRIESKL